MNHPDALQAPPAEPLSVFSCPLDGIQLVEASAGTGKTWNICALYLRLLLERGIEAPAILVVTFSTAATAELRERIRDRLINTRRALRRQLADPTAQIEDADPFIRELLAHLGHLADADDAPTEEVPANIALDTASLLQHIERALETFDEAAIYTIHGFCQRALADAPFGARLPLQLEQAADGPLVEQIATDFWRRHIVAPTANPGLAASLVQRGDSPQQWANILKRRLGRPMATLVWPDGVQGCAFDPAQLDAAHAATRQAFQALRQHWDPTRLADLLAGQQPRLHKTVYAAEKLAEAREAWAALLSEKATEGAIERLFHDGGLNETELKRLALLSLASLQKYTRRGEPAIEAHPFLAAVDAFFEARERLVETSALQRLRLLATFLDEGPATLRGLKREHRQLAFDDMLSNLYRRLYDLDDAPAPDEADSSGRRASNGEALAALLRQRFPAALIDEFQDTDPQQFAIFERVYGDTGLPLFFVGDPKQAIYGFRGADLPTYLQARGRSRARYTLATNQRATPKLIDALEALLGRNRQAFVLDGLDYQPVTAGPRPRSRFVEAAGPEQPGSEGPALRLWQLPEIDGAPIRKGLAAPAAARACAAEVVRLLSGGLADEITLDGRPLRGSDIAILVPKHAWGKLMRRTLAECGVASVELSQDSIFASTDAEDLARILAAISRPSRRGLVLAALATDAMGADAARIAAIHDDDQQLGDVMSRFAGWREVWREHGIAALLRRWMHDEGVAGRLLVRADGERRMTNLMHLAEVLEQASAEQHGPDALLRWFESQRLRAGEQQNDAAQLRLESDRDLVQILTIHRSKGLEFPIVFCPFSWDGAVRPIASGNGQAIHGPDGEGLLLFRDLNDEERDRQRREDAAEQVRLLYVALTRAVHRCYLVVGCYNKGKSTKESLSSPLNWLAASGIAAADWFDGGKPSLDLAGVDAAWQAVVDAAPAAISLAPLPEPALRTLTVPAGDPDRFQALPAPTRPLRGRRVGSYSALTVGATAETAARDRDLFLVDDSSDAAQTTLADDDILLFARGPVAGECLHLVFEQADFRDPTNWPGAIERALLAHPQLLDPDQAQAAMLQRMLADVLATPLNADPTLRLDHIDRRHRLDELEFMLPSPMLRPAELAALLVQHGFPAPTLVTTTLDGWLRGFIDLVFCHDGRYYVLDWKSNHLGDQPADYGPEATAAAMRDHDYHLQALLYTLALHRYLRLRLSDYCYDEHIGGYFYLFVRGVRPDWKTAAGAPAGVVFRQPPLALIEDLDRLFGGGALT